MWPVRFPHSTTMKSVQYFTFTPVASLETRLVKHHQWWQGHSRLSCKTAHPQRRGDAHWPPAPIDRRAAPLQATELFANAVWYLMRNRHISHLSVAGPFVPAAIFIVESVPTRLALPCCPATLLPRRHKATTCCCPVRRDCASCPFQRERPPMPLAAATDRASTGCRGKAGVAATRRDRCNRNSAREVGVITPGQKTSSSPSPAPWCRP